LSSHSFKENVLEIKTKEFTYSRRDVLEIKKTVLSRLFFKRKRPGIRDRVIIDFIFQDESSLENGKHFILILRTF